MPSFLEKGKDTLARGNTFVSAVDVKRTCTLSMLDLSVAHQKLADHHPNTRGLMLALDRPLLIQVGAHVNGSERVLPPALFVALPSDEIGRVTVQ